MFESTSLIGGHHLIKKCEFEMMFVANAMHTNKSLLKLRIDNS